MSALPEATNEPAWFEVIIDEDPLNFALVMVTPLPNNQFWMN